MRQGAFYCHQAILLQSILHCNNLLLQRCVGLQQGLGRLVCELTSTWMQGCLAEQLVFFASHTSVSLASPWPCCQFTCYHYFPLLVGTNHSRLGTPNKTCLLQDALTQLTVPACLCVVWLHVLSDCSGDQEDLIVVNGTDEEHLGSVIHRISGMPLSLRPWPCLHLFGFV